MEKNLQTLRDPEQSSCCSHFTFKLAFSSEFKFLKQLYLPPTETIYLFFVVLQLLLLFFWDAFTDFYAQLETDELI